MSVKKATEGVPLKHLPASVVRGTPYGALNLNVPHSLLLDPSGTESAASGVSGLSSGGADNPFDYLRAQVDDSDYEQQAEIDGKRADSTSGLRRRGQGPKSNKMTKKPSWFVPTLNQNYESCIWRRSRDRWILTIFIGVLTAFTGVFLHLTTHWGFAWKYRTIMAAMEHCTWGQRTNHSLVSSVMPERECEAYVLLAWVCLDAALVATAAVLCVYVSPIAAGSGIPQMKCFLNGVKLPGVLRIRTFIVKILGLVMSSVGGLAIGKEGPCVHAGGIIGGGVSQGRMFGSWCPFDTNLCEFFRSDLEKRDFATAGTAAGVAVAFNAPIGGVLFCMEEGSSYWTQPLTWRTFVASTTCYVVFNTIMGSLDNKGLPYSWTGMSNFGRLPSSTLAVALFDVPIYVLFGIVGGLSGAAYNALNFRVNVYRQHFVRTRSHKVAEAVVIAVLTSTSFFLMLYFVTNCNFATFLTSIDGQPVKMFCDEQQTSEISVFTLQSAEHAMRTTVHVAGDFFSKWSLLIFTVVYYLISVLTYGINVPSGIFVPQCLIGACWGRLLAQLLGHLGIGYGSSIKFVSTYAMLGAAAQLTGVVRMTISLVVILMETVQSLRLALPLMITIWTAKFVGDKFNTGLYDMTIMMNEVPIIDWEPPHQASTVSASEVMSSKVRVFRMRETVSKVYQVLMSSAHHAFPVVSEFTVEDEKGYWDAEDNWVPPQHYGRLEGMITREQLIVLLAERAFDYTSARHECPINLASFRHAFPKYESFLKQVQLNDDDMQKVLDLRLYMDKAPYTATTQSSLRKLYTLLRQLGLRHVIVTNKNNQVVGMVTRKDVTRFVEVRLPNKQTTIQELPINYTDNRQDR